MTRAFEVNLSALSLLALMVGMFLIYNTITFSVVQRRILIGRLRAIGVSRRQVFIMVLLESLLVGLPASIIGLALGVLLSKGLIGLATQTINDLYFVLTVSTVDLSPAVLLKASAIGVLATSLSAVPPAMEATSVDVAMVLRSSSLESRARLDARRLAVFAIGPLVLAIALIALSGKSVWTGYAGLFFVIVMFVLLTPIAVTVGCLVLRWIFGSALGTLGRMAARAVVASLSRTGVAIAALAVAVAATLAVGIMVNSFRGTVEQWLSYTLQADVYVQPPRVIARRGDSRIEATLAEELRELPGVRDSYSVAHESIQTDLGTVDVVVIEPGPMTPRTFRLRSGSEDLWTRLADEDILLLSEPFSYRHDRGVGDHIELTTPEGTRRFRIAGVYVDYASDVGTVLMARSTFKRHLGDPGIAGLALYASEGVAESDLIRQIESRSVGRQELVAQSNAALRGISLDIFDRTFAITSVLRLLAIVVAFIGVLSALMALQLERSREIAVLRANGMSVGQVWGYVSLQTGGMGLLAGILSVPLGSILALLLIHVINRRSFGWTLEVSIDPADMVYTILLATAAAILAGLYPSWVMSRINPSSALRYE
jgi:putative ABC transport system permease protein